MAASCWISWASSGRSAGSGWAPHTSLAIISAAGLPAWICGSSSDTQYANHKTWDAPEIKKHKSMKSNTLLTLLLAASLAPVASRAEEAGSGHYLPGATASFIDALPGQEAFAYVNAFTYYNGSASGSRQLNLGANIVANVEG